MRANHPYTDRTYLLTDGMYCTYFGRQTKLLTQVMIRFAAPYANLVNDGTKKSKPYPFAPIGMAAAETVLEVCASDALDNFCRKVAGG